MSLKSSRVIPLSLSRGCNTSTSSWSRSCLLHNNPENHQNQKSIRNQETKENPINNLGFNLSAEFGNLLVRWRPEIGRHVSCSNGVESQTLVPKSTRRRYWTNHNTPTHTLTPEPRGGVYWNHQPSFPKWAIHLSSLMLRSWALSNMFSIHLGRQQFGFLIPGESAFRIKDEMNKTEPKNVLGHF